MPHPTFRRLVAMVVLALTAASVHAQSPYSCDASACTLPDCHCASTQAPGGLTVADTPQFVVITFDDCITERTEQVTRPLFEDLRNPDGTPALATYFLSLERCPGDGGISDPDLVAKRAQYGDEVGVHTVTHTTSAHTHRAEWRREITGVVDYLNTLGVQSDGLGFRAPYVQTNQALFDELHEQDFLYDASVYEPPFWSRVSTGWGNYVWPHTLDFGHGNHCNWAWNTKCTVKSLPGLWSFPLYYHVDPDRSDPYVGAFDVGHPPYSGGPVITGEALMSVLTRNFQATYSGNRAPHGIFLHAGTFEHEEFRTTYRRALRHMSAQPDTWFVSMSTVIDWMRAPVPASQMPAWMAKRCQPGQACDTVVSTDDREVARAVRLAPTVTTGTVTIFGTITAKEPIRIYDTLGRLVVTVPPDTRMLDLSSFPTGSFFVRIGTDVHMVTRVN